MKYAITLETKAKVYMEISAKNEDEAIDIAYSCIGDTDIHLGKWEVVNVDTGGSDD